MTLKTIPYFTEVVWGQSFWDRLRSTKELHPGIAFYRLMELEDDRKYDKGLKTVVDNAAIHFARQLVDRARDLRRSLEESGQFAVAGFRAALVSRLAIGLGIPSLTENGIWLDHTHGIPIVPGSVLKGVSQDHALLEKDALVDPERNRKVKRDDTGFVALFGAQSGAQDSHFQARRGHVIFFDALPVGEGNPFETDVMTPHYGPYYKSPADTAPADYLKPNPIPFLTVKAGTVFEFALAARRADFAHRKSDGISEQCAIPAETLLDLALCSLKGALFDLGVGGKTRVGYGLFKEV